MASRSSTGSVPAGTSAAWFPEDVILSVAKDLHLVCVALACACAGARPEPEPFTARLFFPADTIRADGVARGPQHVFIYSRTGPWAIHLLIVPLDRCYSAVAAKGAPGAAGRRKTSDILRGLEPAQDVVAGVNADFFSLQTGVPTNALVMRGRVVTPPSRQPVFAIDSAGVPRIEVLEVRRVQVRTRWNDTSLAGVSLGPFHPMEAVGGRPRLTRDSAVLADVDTVGGPGFATTRHPRTAVGIAQDGKRLLIVVVDGRRKPYSDGMTLRELANLMLAFGARDAINLDGGGSTTMVFENPANRALGIVNMPSDSAGERSVGDVLAIVRNCRGR